jgi:hypothetical protein
MKPRPPRLPSPKGIFDAAMTLLSACVNWPGVIHQNIEIELNLVTGPAVLFFTIFP